VQECGAGLVTIREGQGRLAFAAPPLRREGPLDDAVLTSIINALGVDPALVRDAQWIDNGPGWIGLLLADAEDVLALEPDFAALAGHAVGVTAPYTSGDGDMVTFETRAFVPGKGVPEDPVTGSLAAGFALWLVGAGIAPDRYLVRQGTRLGRRGLIHIHRDGELWIGGDTVIGITGQVQL
jgi:PhzF family phenazine biosynthesis protein